MYDDARMTISWILSTYFVRPEDVSPDFNATVFLADNPYALHTFYVPPHPLLYLVTGRLIEFLIVSFINFFSMDIRASSYIQALLVPVFFVARALWYISTWPGVYRYIYIVVKVIVTGLDKHYFIELLERVQNEIFGNRLRFGEATLWLFNSFSFGIFATWPLIRPDVFQEYLSYYCFGWSC